MRPVLYKNYTRYSVDYPLFPNKKIIKFQKTLFLKGLELFCVTFEEWYDYSIILNNNNK
jgi:hypothetical protein